MACIDAFIGICGKLIPRNVEQFLIPPMLKLFDDKSYRVRLKTAQTIKELQRAVGPSMSKSFLVPTLSKYFTDPITDVRTASIDRTVDFCSNLEYNARIQFLSEFLLPQLEGLYSDPCNKVRLAVCDFMKLAQFLPLDSVKKHFTPAVLTLLHDECHVVQCRAATNLKCIKHAVDVTVLSNSINAEMLIAIKLNKFEKLLKIIDAIPFYASALGGEFLDEKLVENIIRAEASHKNALIRMVALNAVKKCVNILGINWVEKHLLHQLKSLSKKEGFTSDRQCFTWAQVVLSGLPVVIASESVLEYLEELNKRNFVDKSELRSIVFRAIQLAKKTMDEDSLKRTVEKLESSIFSEPSDKEYLQFALTDSSNPELVPDIFVEPPTNMGVKLRRKKFQDPEDKSKRFSLPATPLFEESAKFDFKSLPSSETSNNFFNVSNYESKHSSNFSRVRSTSYSRISDVEPASMEVLNVKIEPSEKALEPVKKAKIKEEIKLVRDEVEEDEPFELIQESEYEKSEPKFISDNSEPTVTSENSDQSFSNQSFRLLSEESQITAEPSRRTEADAKVPEININKKLEFYGMEEKNIETELKEISMETVLNSEIVEVEVPEIILNEKQEFYSEEEKIIMEPEINKADISTFASENQEVEIECLTETEEESRSDSRMFESVSEETSEQEVYVDVVSNESDDEEEEEEEKRESEVIDDVMMETESVSDSSEDSSREAATSGEVGEDEQFLDAEEDYAIERVNGLIEPEVEEQEVADCGKIIHNASEFRMTHFLVDFNDDEIDV